MNKIVMALIFVPYAVWHTLKAKYQKPVPVPVPVPVLEPQIPMEQIPKAKNRTQSKREWVIKNVTLQEQYEEKNDV
jgi:hypothetical protein